ncbi:prephenate dehydrogenase [Ornithinibacillus californiensis]|uniref:prephenate dehydrogenase n=1 Tax=Ornithinibacillus californiensis TaxID=161536 RepID=UPI00064DE046|nr:prephenate dehydrogenase [Ornithinibacillus californiensis]
MQGNVLIIGLGLIGGSLALAIKKQHPEARIYGYDVKQSEMRAAKSLQVIDEKVGSLRKEAEMADLIILSTPVLQMEKVIKQLAGYDLKENVLITDTGSTKRGVIELAEELWQGESVTFIGGHPMAGSHKSGVESARAHLFENAYYVLTPSSSSPHRIEELKQWLGGANSQFLVLDKEEHDYVTGVISHLPHIIASGLVNQTRKDADRHPLVSLLAAGGFRDITRIASSSPEMWKEIVKQNRMNLLGLLDNWVDEMKHFQHSLLNGDDLAISHFFEDAKEYRDSLPVRSKGAIPSYYDLYVDVIDVPGSIAGVTTLLAEHGISLTNLHIMENREGLLGVLRISFQKEEDRTKAQNLLNFHAYKTYEAA